MLHAIVRYLHDNDVSFQLDSHPAPEAQPHVAHPVPPGGLWMDTRIILVAGRPGIACIPPDTEVNLPGLSAALDAVVIEGTLDDLPTEFAAAGLPAPPVGSLMGVPIFVDEIFLSATMVTFRAGAHDDYFDLSYDDLALLEQPWVGQLAITGELPEASEPEIAEATTAPAKHT